MKKTIIFCVRLILCCASISMACADEQNYNRLLNRTQFNQLNTAAIKRLQHDLGIVYQNDLEWKDDVHKRSRPLTDGVIGPVTLFWLQQFVTDFKIEPMGDFVDQLIDRLKAIAMFADKYPEEIKVLLSSDFAHWNDTQPALQRDQDYNIRCCDSDQKLLALVQRYQQKDLLPDTPGNRFSTTAYYYQLTADDFKMLQGKEQILNRLAKLENQYFNNLSLLEEAVYEEFQPHSELYKRLSPVIKTYYSDHEPVITQPFIEYLTQAAINDPLMASLNKVIAGLLEKELSGVTYPDPTLFDKAAQDRIHAGIGACYPSQAHKPYILALKFSDEEFKQLSNDLLTSPDKHGLAELRQHLQKIEELRGREEQHCSAEEEKEVDAFVRKLYENIVQPAIALLYKKKPVLEKTLSIRWNGNGCGCVLDNLSGTVYGFYPFWMANGAEQTVNFSVLSRVAYDGLSFDQRGTLLHMNDPENHALAMASDELDYDNQKQFIEEARKHNSKVDWVIYNDQSYWENWKKLPYKTREAIFESLTDNIVKLLTRPVIGYFSGIKQALSLDMLPDPTQGDGVTLDFRGYPNDAESIDLFNRFHDDLREKLNATHGEYVINMMVLQSKMGEGIYRFTNLIERIRYQPIVGFKGKILVLLNEPVTYSKKKLRIDVENAGLHGQDIRTMSRNIIPVITFAGHNWVQLEDDLIYFKDNFGGAGFWPLAVNEQSTTVKKELQCNDIRTIGGCLVRFFQTGSQRVPDSFIDRFVCEHRSLFRIALVLLTGLSLFLLITYLFSCHQRRKYKNYYISGIFATVIPALIIALLLLLYDPVLESYSEGNIPLIVVVSGTIFVSLVLYQRKRKRTKKPVRPRVGTTTA